jgi:hypothetical protein
MGSTPNPISVYPDPDGGRTNAYTPVNTTVQVVSIVSGAISTGAAAMGSGTAPDTAFLFLAEVYRGTGFMAFHAAKASYVAIAVIFGALSVLLSVINLVNGFRMKERLRALSEKVCTVCKTAGLFT